MAGQKKRWWLVRFISGFCQGVASLAIRGVITPNLNPYHETDNPDGWHADSVVTYGFFEARMQEYAEQQRIANDRLLAQNALLYTICEKLAEANGIALEGEITGISVSSDGEVIL